MKRLMMASAAVFVIAAAILTRGVFAGPGMPFAAAEREAYIAKGIAAFKRSPKDSLKHIYNFVNDMEKSQCRSFFDQLTLNCLQTEIKRDCDVGIDHANPDCPVLTDIMVVNKVNERQMISKEERLRISQKPDDYLALYSKTLNNKYALLVTDLLLHPAGRCTDGDMACFARGIDSYCQKNAGSKNIAWQACVAAIVYYTGTR